MAREERREEADEEIPWIDPEILLNEEERLAAEEAAAIGGHAGDENLDPANRPVIEAGGGESEGFELSEQDLIRRASHGDEHSDAVVFRDAAKPEAESDRQTGSFGEGDAIDSANRNDAGAED